jgi:hypothetical protein
MVFKFTPDPLFYSIENRVNKIKATQDELDRIFDAAYKGLSGDALAIAAGFMPVDFNILCQSDSKAAEAVIYGRAQNEADISGVLMNNALNGDTKAATTVLTHKHGWKPAKPDNDGSAEIRIVVENAEPHLEPGANG